MKMLLRSGMALLLAAGCLLQTQSMAGDKKDKKKEPAKDIVINGEITNADVKDKEKTDCFCKTYTHKMVEGRTYQILMRSKDLDSWLRLEDGAGKKVAEDDDSGGGDAGHDALIKYKAPKSGDHTIICTTFGENETGKFTLTVKDVTDNPPKDEDKKPKIRPLPPVKNGVIEIDRPLYARESAIFARP